MYRVTSTLFLVIALFSATGGQLAILQITAWTGMVIRYSEESGLARGIERTFSGEEPCQLCHVVERAQEESEQQKPAVPARAQLESEVFEAPESLVGYPSSFDLLEYPQLVGNGAQRKYEVPVPPPRTVS